MRMLALNPKAYAVAVVVMLGFGLTGLLGGFVGGYVVRGWKCKASAGTAAAKVERVEDRRDENIEAIASATAGAVAAAITENRSDTHASVHTIRTVEVPAACRDVPADILRELRAGAESANAALGVGVRPGAAGAGAADR